MAEYKRACWYRPEVPNVDRTKSPWRTGCVIGWGQDSQVGEHGLENFPVAIVEDQKTQAVHSVYVELITFASVPGGPVDR